MTKPQRLLDVILAAGFTSRELGIIAERALGASLDGITQESEPQQQAIALVEFAEKHGMERELRSAVLSGGADRPALQNLLMGEHMTSQESGERDNNQANYAMLRIESKLDQVLAEQARQSQQQAQMAQAQTQFDRRLYAVETAVQKPAPAVDKLAVLVLAVVLAAMFLYTVLGARM